MAKSSKKYSSSAKPKGALGERSDVDGAVIFRTVGILGILCIICTVVFDKSKEMGGAVFPIMSLLALAFFTAYLWFSKKLTVQNAVLVLFAAGFILRLNYVLYTPLSETTRIRQHDLWGFGGDKGHSAYIEHFYNNGFSLPDFDPTTKTQFYHPPLHHLLAAMWMRILTTFGMGYSRAIGSMQFLTLFYSSCCMIVCERIFDKLRVYGAYKLTALSVVVFHPTFIILSGSVNNDILSVLFTLLAVYTALRWYKEPTTKNIMYIALSIGLGMSTKLSVALVAIPIALLFLMKLIADKKRVYENFTQFCLFGLVCIPLGLWYSVRNAVRFKVPFTYVQKLSEDSDQYIGDKTFFERIFDFSYHPFENVFLNREATGADFYEYNPLVAICKTSLFGEYNFADTNEHITPFCRILLVINIVMILLSVAALVMFIIKRVKYTDNAEKIFPIFYQLLMFGYFIKFCFNFPHNCSMDYRYIVPTCVLGAFFIGAETEQLYTQLEKKNNTAAKAVKIGTISVTALFCLFSAIVFIMLGVSTQ